METADVVVVGLGAMGSAALYQLAKRGVRAVGIDRYVPPHPLGSTHGETRLTRVACAEGAAYVPLALRSRDIWRELEAATGETLLSEIGGLIIAGPDGGHCHGAPGYLDKSMALAREFGIAHESLDAAEIRRRYPQFQVADGDRGYFEPTIGVLYPETAVAVQLRLAQQLGAVVRTGEQVLAVEPNGSGVTVRTDKGPVQAAQVILAAGAWLPGMLGGPLQANAAVQRQVLLWWEADEPALYDPARCPIFIWMHGPTPHDYLYGFPIMPGASGVKAGTERYEGAVNPDTVQRDIPQSEWRGIHARHIAGRLRGVSDRMTKAVTCLYTVTTDQHFVLDRVQDRVIVASTCSGHGFKHSPALGEALAVMAVDGRGGDAAFALERFAA